MMKLTPAQARKVSSTFTNFDPEDKTWSLFDVDKAREDFKKATVTDGVPRWDSNNSVPPEDCLEAFKLAGCEFDFDAAIAARDADTDAFLEEYRRNQKPATGEELFEMRAAFGEGTTVVDIFTGRETKL
jgi:hypothetical protein